MLNRQLFGWTMDLHNIAQTLMGPSNSLGMSIRGRRMGIQDRRNTRKYIKSVGCNFTQPCWSCRENTEYYPQKSYNVKLEGISTYGGVLSELLTQRSTFSLNLVTGGSTVKFIYLCLYFYAYIFISLYLDFPRHWNTELVFSGVNRTLWGKGFSLSLVGHHSSDDGTMKISYGVDYLLHQPASHPIFSYGLG